MNTPEATAPETTLLDDLDRTLRAEGPDTAIDRLIEALEQAGSPRELLDALLLKARHDLGLPAVLVGPLAGLPEPARTQYEDRYVAAIRRVGGKLLEAGDIPGAWTYFRAIAETEPVAAALESLQLTEAGTQEEADRLSRLIEIAFHQGAHPRRGFELILEHYGICSAITAFEHLPPDETTRVACVDRLVEALHDGLVQSLRAEIARHGEPEPPADASIPNLITERGWLFEDDAYHVDISHLAAVVRSAPLASDQETIRRAAALAEYGRNLSDRYRLDGEPPFDDLYEDHYRYFRALLGEDVDEAITHFRAKVAPPDPDGPGPETLPAQILVRLLERLGRFDEAIDVAAEHLAGVPASLLACTPLDGLCQRAGRPDRLARIAREHNDPVNYLAAILQTDTLPAS